MIKYIVLEDNVLCCLEHKVNNAIIDGYEPIGGVAVCEIETGLMGRMPVFYQAMTIRRDA